MRNHSRFIPGEEIEAVARWSFSAVDTTSLLLAAESDALRKAEDQTRDETVRQEGYALGFSEGFTQGQARALAVRVLGEPVFGFQPGAGLTLRKAFGESLRVAFLAYRVIPRLVFGPAPRVGPRRQQLRPGIHRAEAPLLDRFDLFAGTEP